MQRLIFHKLMKKNLITHETTDISFFEMINEIEESIKIDNDEIDQNVKSDEKSFFSKSRNEDLARDFADIKINQLSKQLNQSTFTFQLIASNCFSKNIFKSNYVKLNNLNYKSRDRDDRRKNAVKKIIEFSTQIDKTRDFAVKIKKIRIFVAVAYKIFTF